jgi:glyoxylase-like metal-dependent hydrolase (beta-lactamase superfamily II)/8-oxo-dGTP pyrophosphatase MutT (NUDIX family)
MLTRGERVLLVRRSPRLKAFANLWAFPGGTVSGEDSAIPVRGAPDAETGARIAAAVREVFEETGVFLGTAGRDPEAVERDALRRRLLAGEIGLRQVLEGFGAEIEAGSFVEVEKLTTPESAPFRFDTWFYRLRLPAGAEPSVWPGEIVDQALLSPETALTRWRRGEMALAPPIIGLLERWSPDDDVFRDRNREEGRRRPAVRYSPGVAVIPCRTRTLPPATHTNAVLIGASRRYLVDPAAEESTEREMLFGMVDRLLGPGDRLAGILVTHHHPDHIGSVAAASSRYGVPVGAHPETLSRCPTPAGGTRPLAEGDSLDLGEAPDGSPGWALEVRFVPGHAPGHLAFVENRYGAMVVGDMVSSLSSILISPEDGDLGEYMASLRRLAVECRGIVYPGHGVPVVAGRDLLRGQLRHRESREASLLAALDTEPASLRSIGLRVYPATELPPRGPVRRLAEVALTSGLLKLEREGRARVAAGKWFRQNDPSR